MPRDTVAHQGPPAGPVTPQKKEGDPLSLSGGPQGPPGAPYYGVYTFLRIRPPSPSYRGPQCLGYLSPGDPRDPSSTQQSTLPVGPPWGLHQPPGAPPCETSDEAESEPPGPQLLLSTEMGAPKGVRGLPSLASGRIRAQTSLLEEKGPRAHKDEPQVGPPLGLSTAAVGAVERGVSVMVLPPEAPAGQRGPRGAPSKTSRCLTPLGARMRASQSRPELKQGPPSAARPCEGDPPGAPQGSLPTAPPPMGLWGLRGPPLCPKTCVGKTGYEGPFRFAAVLPQSATQEETFRAVGRPAAEALMAGFNACIAVYVRV